MHKLYLFILDKIKRSKVPNKFYNIHFRLILLFIEIYQEIKIFLYSYPIVNHSLFHFSNDHFDHFRSQRYIFKPLSSFWIIGEEKRRGKKPRIKSWFRRCRSWVKRPTDAQLIGNPCKGVHIRFYFTVSFMRET